MNATPEELLQAALDEIDPPYRDCERCRQQIRSLRAIELPNDPTPGELREQIEKYSTAAKRFRSATKKLSPLASRLLFGHLKHRSSDVLADLDTIIRFADYLTLGGIQVPRSGNKSADEIIALVTAYLAHGLLTEFSRKRPSMTTDGPFQTLTRILCEYLSGRRPRSVERACDAVVKDLGRAGTNKP